MTLLIFSDLGPFILIHGPFIVIERLGSHLTYSVERMHRPTPRHRGTGRSAGRCDIHTEEPVAHLYHGGYLYGYAESNK